MGENTAIQWTDKTWNPWQGCTKVSPGCAKCYMYRDKAHYGQDPTVVVRSKTTFTAPLKWTAPARVFTCSWSDFFHEAADPWRADAWDIIRRTPHLTYQILTKRPERLAACLPPDWGAGWPHVWLGTSVENQHWADVRIPLLLHTPAVVRFLSCEPLLGSVDLVAAGWDTCPGCGGSGERSGYYFAEDGMGPCRDCEARGVLDTPGIDWVIVGGESGGKDARPMRLDWVQNLVEQGQAADVAVFVKQLGSVWARTAGLHDSHGGDMSEWPQALQVRQFPEVPVHA